MKDIIQILQDFDLPEHVVSAIKMQKQKQDCEDYAKLLRIKSLPIPERADYLIQTLYLDDLEVLNEMVIAQSTMEYVSKSIGEFRVPARELSKALTCL
jgi:hypothetical protein